jgi:hypothetical protein
MRAFVAALTFVALCLGSGCVTEPSEVAEHLGNSQRYLRDAQIENPEPLPGRVDGLDPRSAEHVLENYSKGQKAQEHGESRNRAPGSFIFGDR